MLKSYLKITCRSLWKNKTFSFINIMGLAVAFTACFFIYLYVSYEISYDAYNAKADRIYRVVTTTKTTEGENYTLPPFAMGRSLQQEFPEIGEVARIVPESFGGRLVSYGDKRFQEDNILYADSSLFSIFSFPMIKGDSHKALAEPFSAVISETAAHKYFGSANPMGKSLLMENFNVTVTGVMKDIPVNSQFRSDIIISLVTETNIFTPGEDDKWVGAVDTYMLLPVGYNTKRLTDRLPAFTNRHVNRPMSESRSQVIISLEPLRQVYLHSAHGNLQKGSLTNIYIFTSVAIIILLIACINFINLSIAHASARAKEVSIRKLVGSTKKQLIAQFLFESILTSFLAFVVSCLFSMLALPVFNAVSGKIISTGIFSHPTDISLLLVVALITGLLPGIYPALIISALKPNVSVTAGFVKGVKGILLRKVLGSFTICHFNNTNHLHYYSIPSAPLYA